MTVPRHNIGNTHGQAGWGQDASRRKKAKAKARAKARSTTGARLVLGNLPDVGAHVVDESALDNMDWSNTEKRPLPKESEVMQPFGWKVLVMPMRPESISKGGILMPQVRQDTDQYLNYIGRIVALGPLAFRHGKYLDMGLRPEDQYKRGDWVIYPIYQYARIDYKGTKLIILNDDSFLGRVQKGANPWDFKVER